MDKFIAEIFVSTADFDDDFGIGVVLEYVFESLIDKREIEFVFFLPDGKFFNAPEVYGDTDEDDFDTVFITGGG